MTPAEAERLEVIAARWWAETRDRSHYRYIEPEQWPAEIRRLGPRAVRVREDGVYIPRGEFFVTEWGWFVKPAGSKFEPRPAGDPSYRRLHGQVYWYKIEG